MAALKDATNSRINLNGSGTEAAPYSIESVVTDVADTAYIEQVGKVIYIKKPFYVTTGFLLVKDYLTIVMAGGSFVNDNNAADGPTNGIEFQGGCTIVFQSGLGGFGSAVQWGTGTLKITGVNGIYPTIRQQQGARHDTFLSVNNELDAANYANVVLKVDGVTLQLSNEAHLKWYTQASASYLKNINIQRAASGYTGSTPTAFQLAYGTVLTDARSSEFAVAGDFPETAQCSLVRPVFDIAASSPMKGYFWGGMDIVVIDPRFAAGGSWNGKISPDACAVSGTGTGARLRHKTSYTAVVAQGNTRIAKVKLAFFPTKTGAHAKSEAVAAAYVLTDAAGKIAEQTLLYKEWFATDTTANKAADTTTTWRVTARHPPYVMTHELQAAAGATSLLADGVSATDHPYCGLTKAQAEAVAAPYAGIALDRATTTITLTAARTLDELHDYIRWWLYQDTQMDLADFMNPTGTQLDLGAWSITGGQHLAAGAKLKTVKTTGTLSSMGELAIAVDDANGNSSLIFDSVDSWTVFGDAARTVQLGTGTVAAAYRFVYAAGTTYYLRLIVAGETLDKTVAPAAKGVTPVTLSQVALLSAIKGQIEMLPEAVKTKISRPTIS